jgi:xylulokinase
LPQLDVGTQGCKALVYCTSTHAVVGRGSASYPLAHPRPGAAEQDPEEWLRGLETAIAAALRGLDAQRVQAVAVSGQQHGMVVVDAAGKARPQSVMRLSKAACTAS